MTGRKMVGVMLWLLVSQCAFAQGVLQKQVLENGPVADMTQQELNELGDPLFVLLLKTQPQENRLDKILETIQGQTGQRRLFVVDEKIVDPAPGQTRRVVMAFTGTNQNQRLDPNVTLSFFFTSNGFLTDSIEAWGWDNTQGRYNYYKLDRQGGAPTPTWKFRGSSVDADEKTPQLRERTCLVCHINGGPVMKELLFPWNNWHSARSPATYLQTSANQRWPIADSPLFRELKGAEDLETTFLLPSIRQFNDRRIDALIRRDSSGTPQTFPGQRQEIIDAPRLLRPLLETTEYNLISSAQFSGLHPIPQIGTGPAEPIKVPDSFFLNANLLAGGGATNYAGLGVSEARTFGTLLQLSPDEYRGAVERAGTKVGARPGDTNFAWFVPEASHIDNHLVDKLVQRGVITKEFTAAVLALDVENPVFSKKTPLLKSFIPATFQFTPVTAGAAPATHPDALTETVIQNLQAASPPAGSVAADFLVLLQSANPVQILQQRVNDYRARVDSRLGGGQTRQEEIDRLFQLMIARRLAAKNHPVLGPLAEFSELFPLP